jgi:hypothetical protein
MARYGYNRSNMPGARVEVAGVPGGAMVHVPRAAASPGFRAGLSGFANNPGLRALGIGLTGLPIALGAVDQLGREPDNPAGNLAGAAGSVGGGIGGLLGGAKIGGLMGGPYGAMIGGALGAFGGGELLGGAARGVTNAVTGLMNDPLSRQIRDAERLARSQVGMQNEALLASLPAMQALAAQQRQQEAEQADLALRTQLRSLYQQGMLGPSNVPVNGYSTPGYGNALAQVAMGAFG